MKIRHQRKKSLAALFTVSVVIAAVLLFLVFRKWHPGSSEVGTRTTITIHDLRTSTVAKPALTVLTAHPFFALWPEILGANGNVAAWQNVAIDAEVNGLQLIDVKVDVGDSVHKGQLLAVFYDGSVKADAAEAKAALAGAEAAFDEAKANADRARKVHTPGVLSRQQIDDYLIAERLAAAKLHSAHAQFENQQIRLRQTRVVAPDDGVISSRTAAVGAVMASGQELFRLIRSNRLEWRGEVASAELPLVKVDQVVTISAPGRIQATGLVRVVGPTVDPQTRMGTVYVDIRQNSGLKAGMFAHGDIELGTKRVMALPQSAVVQRDGFDYVYRVDLGNRVYQTKVETGRRYKTWIEILGGLNRHTEVVTTGAAFLADGDTVRIEKSPQKPPESEQ